MGRDYILPSCVLLCALYLVITDAAVVRLCETLSTPAGADGVIFTHPSIIGTQQEQCQFNLTDIAPNSWVRFKIDLEEEQLDQLCDRIRNIIHCPTAMDNSQCEEALVTCYIPRNLASPQIISLNVPKSLVNLGGLTMSYKVAQVVQHNQDHREVQNYTTGVTSDIYGYAVSHRRYDQETDFNGDQMSSLSFRLNKTCITQRGRVTFTFLFWEIDDNCENSYLEVNSVRFCKDNATVGVIYSATPPLQQLELTFKVSRRRKRGFLMRFQVITSAPGGRSIPHISSNLCADMTATTQGPTSTPGGWRSSELPCYCPNSTSMSSTTVTFTNSATGKTPLMTTTGHSRPATKDDFLATTASMETNATKIQQDLDKNDGTITALTAVCIVLGLMLILVSLGLLALLIKQRRYKRGKAGQPSEFATNEVYLSNPIEDGPLSNDPVPPTSKKRAPPIGGNEYCYVDDSTLPVRGTSQCQGTDHRHEDHVYAGTDYYDLEDDTELSPQSNQYQLADEIVPAGDQKPEEDNFYHCVEPSAPSESTLPREDKTQHSDGHYFEIESPQMSTESAQNHVEITINVSDSDAADGYVDLSKLPVEHVRRSALMDTEHQERVEQEDNVELVENTLYHSQN